MSGDGYVQEWACLGKGVDMCRAGVGMSIGGGGYVQRRRWVCPEEEVGMSRGGGGYVQGWVCLGWVGAGEGWVCIPNPHSTN